MDDLLDMFDRFEEKPPTAPKHLKPPPLAKPIKIEPMTKIGHLSFDEIANSSEFKRFIFYLFEGKTHRGTADDLDRKLNNHHETLEIVQDLRKGSYGDVMKEFKDKVAKIKSK